MANLITNDNNNKQTSGQNPQVLNNGRFRQAIATLLNCLSHHFIVAVVVNPPPLFLYVFVGLISVA